MITQYLSNVELYFLKQISKCISNGVREEFMNKREKEQVLLSFIVFSFSDKLSENCNNFDFLSIRSS